MPDTPPSRFGTVRLPDWWSTKPPRLPSEPSQTEQPAHAPDWWDALYGPDDQPTPSAEPHAPAPPTGSSEEQVPTPDWWTPKPDYYPRPHTPGFITETPARSPLSPKTRAALYNASAAGTGWALGLYDQFADAIASCGTDYSVSGALVLGTGGCLLIAHVWDRRTRHWWPGIAWAARIPLATAIVALALWAPAAS